MYLWPCMSQHMIIFFSHFSRISHEHAPAVFVLAFPRFQVVIRRKKMSSKVVSIDNGRTRIEVLPTCLQSFFTEKLFHSVYMSDGTTLEPPPAPKRISA